MAFNIGGLLSQGKGGGILSENLMQFLQSPEAMAMAGGLLAGGAPSLTEVPSLGRGFSLGLQGMKASKESGLDRKLKERGLDLEERGLGIEEQYKRAQITDLQEKAAQRAVQRDFVNKMIFGDGMAQGQEGAEVGAGGAITSDKQRRAQQMAAAGYYDEAMKILTEREPASEAATATIAANQAKLTAINAMKPRLEKLIKQAESGELPMTRGTGFIKTGKQKEYDADIADVVEKYTKAFDLGKSNESLALGHTIFERGTLESEVDYARRMRDELKKLEEEEKVASQITKPLFTPSRPEERSAKPEEKPKRQRKSDEELVPLSVKLVTITDPATKKSKTISRTEALKILREQEG